jgi:hypothetical protein
VRVGAGEDKVRPPQFRGTRGIENPHRARIGFDHSPWIYFQYLAFSYLDFGHADIVGSRSDDAVAVGGVEGLWVDKQKAPDAEVGEFKSDYRTGVESSVEK